MDEYGADALRMTLLFYGIAQGTDDIKLICSDRVEGI